MSEHWTRVEPTEIQRVGWRTIVTKSFQLPDGTIATFDTIGIEHERAAATIAITPEKQVVVARLFRPGQEQVMIELPGGMVDAGEEPQTSALRELEEETGFIPSESSEIVSLGSIPEQNAYANGDKNYFMITNVILKGATKYETEETIKVDKISISQLIENAKKGRMTDAVAVLLAYDQLVEIDKE